MNKKLKKIRELYEEFQEFYKYCIVGITGTLVDLGSLFVFVEFLHIAVIPATTLAFLLAVSNNFLLNKNWTFKNKSKNYRKLFLKFLIISTIGLYLTLGLMYTFVHLFDIWYMLAKLITSVIVLTWNFLGNKLWTFRLKNLDIDIPLTFPFDISIVIPSYNEENRIKTTLLIFKDFISTKNLNAEIIVVDDGSKDKTSEIVNSFKNKIKNLRLIRYKKNRGKGYAVKRGVQSSKGKYILFADADNSTPIEELEKLITNLQENNAHIAVGSRYLPNSNVKIKQPKYRIILGRLGNFIIRLFLIDDIKDTQCGFKLFSHKAAKEIFSLQKVRRFGFDMEALIIAKNLDYKIIEVPVSWFNSTESRVRPIKDALITLKDLIYIKLNLWSGRYSSD